MGFDPVVCHRCKKKVYQSGYDENYNDLCLECWFLYGVKDKK